ncbi:MAG: hypothetical protein KME16_00770 [Scytolyngbya sp. HA4215-MV1]|jgi:hypothetical protein|nr:hypothetical protein [Scytolyngbya sp. HA4215-MV1]
MEDLTISIQTQPVAQSRLLSFGHSLHWVMAPLYRIGWHTHAYATIFGIMFLTLLSLIALYFHSQFGKLLKLHPRSGQSAQRLPVPARRSQ